MNSNTRQPAEFDPLVDTLPARFVVGIDLGTTNSAVNYVDTEQDPWSIKTFKIPQQVSVNETEALESLPSFYFQPILGNAQDKRESDFCVGAWARDETAKSTRRGISSAKSWLCHSGVDRSAALLPWNGAEDVRRLSPIEVSAAYLKHIAVAWNREFPLFPLDQQDVVVTLPASFDEVARELTIAAAAQAGLSRIFLIEEPQAAFYAWVYRHAEDWQHRMSVGQKILVCDIGGGTTDFTLIRVRSNTRSKILNEHDAADTADTSDSSEASKHCVQFHRVAVGDHLILGGDNLDLAVAKYIEKKLVSSDHQLEPHQWDALIGISRKVKESMLTPDQPDVMTVNLPGRGSKLVGGSLQTEITRDEILELLLEGFLPSVSVNEVPQRHQSGFQEFGLPYASDPAITRYLGSFLKTHAQTGCEEWPDTETNVGFEANNVGKIEGDRVGQDDPEQWLREMRPDIVLFNGGFFASPFLKQRVLQQLNEWFATDNEPDWVPQVLENPRLDLAVAQGAAYYGMVRRDRGVRIAATLARSYYIEIGGGSQSSAVCIMPGSAQAGESFKLNDRKMRLTIGQPVEFRLLVSSVRLADQPGLVLPLDREQLTALPPIRTVLKSNRRSETGELQVQLTASLTELGTIDLACQEIDQDRMWRLQFDVRSTTQTDVAQHQGLGESEGVLDETVWSDAESILQLTFATNRETKIKANVKNSGGTTMEIASSDPKQLIHSLKSALGIDREQWPMSLLRRIWETLIEHQSGRKISPQHESRWLNLLGYALRPGYGVALDDWRVTETWRIVGQKTWHNGSYLRNELLVLWRRLAGGLSRGQQMAIAEPWLACTRNFRRQGQGKPPRGAIAILRPEEMIEVWRLLGAMELLPTEVKRELGETILELLDKPKMVKVRPAMVWALGRLAQRRPLYGPLNTVLPVDVTGQWIDRLLASTCAGTGAELGMPLTLVQMARMTGDRYRDVDNSRLNHVINWLERNQIDPKLIDLVSSVGVLDREQQGQILGDSLPIGLMLDN